MKKWNNPDLMMLGVDNTEECECLHQSTTLDKDQNKNLHYCHDWQAKGLNGPWHQNNCTSLGAGHTQSGSLCGGVHWNEEHKSNCCCAGLS